MRERPAPPVPGLRDGGNPSVQRQTTLQVGRPHIKPPAPSCCGLAMFRTPGRVSARDWAPRCTPRTRRGAPPDSSAPFTLVAPRHLPSQRRPRRLRPGQATQPAPPLVHSPVAGHTSLPSSSTTHPPSPPSCPSAPWPPSAAPSPRRRRKARRTARLPCTSPPKTSLTFSPILTETKATSSNLAPPHGRPCPPRPRHAQNAPMCLPASTARTRQPRSSLHAQPARSSTPRPPSATHAKKYVYVWLV